MIPQSVRRQQRARVVAAKLPKVPGVSVSLSTWDEMIRTAALFGWEPSPPSILDTPYLRRLDRCIPIGMVIDRQAFYLTRGGRYVMLAERRDGLTIVAVTDNAEVPDNG